MNIILASNSPQRKKLLKKFGIKFKTIPSNAPEIQKITTTCSALVKKNAEMKALNVASRVKQGLVIGSDSVVYIGNKKIIGKPRTLKEAKRNLKILFSRPHWVYTGVAVVDASTGKKIVDYEKTKIFMTPLNDKEIDKYHKKVRPFGKAGGFDIEGWGSIFIRRIEGCYSNVIGLPMAKLNSMLKKFGVTVLCAILFFNLTGCTSSYNLATKKEETLMYSTDKEVKIGANIAKQIEEKYDINEDVDINEKVNRILDSLVKVSDRKDIVYFIKIIDDDEVNAASLPGGYIFVNKGIIDAVDNDDELASVIAHELGHITARHGIKKLQAAYGALFIQVLASQTDGNLALGANAAINTLFSEYSQKDELEADRLSIKYLKKAGYDPQGMIDMLYKLKEVNDKRPIKRFGYLRSHPYLPKRIAAANAELNGKISFRDYLNLTEEGQ